MNKDNIMKDDKNCMAYWLGLSEKYFDALTTPEEERALASFLATEESNRPEFNDIKAVMGFLATAHEVNKKHKSRKRTITFINWGAAAACIALIAGTWMNLSERTTVTDKTEQTVETEEKNDIYIAYIDGKKYTDKNFVLEQMHNTMTGMSSAAGENIVEERLMAMFSINH